MSVPPGITIEPLAFWCQRHLEPFRPVWPLGYLPATLWLLYQSLLRDDIQEAASGQTELLDRVVREFGPICCLLGDDLVEEATRRALSDDADVVRALIAEATQTEAE